MSVTLVIAMVLFLRLATADEPIVPKNKADPDIIRGRAEVDVAWGRHQAEFDTQCEIAEAAQKRGQELAEKIQTMNENNAKALSDLQKMYEANAYASFDAYIETERKRDNSPQELTRQQFAELLATIDLDNYTGDASLVEMHEQLTYLEDDDTRTDMANDLRKRMYVRIRYQLPILVASGLDPGQRLEYPNAREVATLPHEIEHGYLFMTAMFVLYGLVWICDVLGKLTAPYAEWIIATAAYKYLLPLDTRTKVAAWCGLAIFVLGVIVRDEHRRRAAPEEVVVKRGPVAVGDE